MHIEVIRTGRPFRRWRVESPFVAVGPFFLKSRADGAAAVLRAEYARGRDDGFGASVVDYMDGFRDGLNAGREAYEPKRDLATGRFRKAAR